MRNPDHWDLIQIVTRQRVNDLSSAQFFQHANSLAGEEQKNWYAWRAGMASWVCVVQLMKQYGVNSAQEPEPSLKLVPSPTLTHVPVENPIAQVIPPKFEQVRSGSNDRRKHHRHSVRTKVVVMLNGQVYRAFSKDISVGGLLLMNQIPWKFEDTNCTVFVSNPQGGQALEFTGKVLSDPKDPCRFQFQDPSERFLATLNQWLEGTKLNSMKSAA